MNTTMESTKTIPPFHLAFPVNDLPAAKEFYCQTIGCSLGRSSDSWIDFNLFGHQIVAHLKPDSCNVPVESNAVDGKEVPIPHFGLVLSWDDWHALAGRLKAANTNFAIEPYIRFEGEVGEQATMFLHDPAGNALEFKSFKDINQMFAS